MKNKFIYKLFIIVLLVTSSPVSVFAGGGWDLPEPAPYLTNGIKLVNLDNSGNKKNFESEYNPPSISADGRYVSFYSGSTDLVTNDTNEAGDVFVRDTVSNTTTRVSVSSSGEEGNGDSTISSISADGRYVIFESYASNLVDGDTNEAGDVFVRDTVSNTTTRISVSSSGEEGNGDSTKSSISADGRYVVFSSDASNLVEGDTNGQSDVFLRDTQENTTTRVSVSSSGEEGNSYVWGDSTPSISADGRM